MLYSNFGKTNLKVSKFSLGTMTFGGHTSVEESLSIIDYAIDKGINLIDTADIYNQGESEKIVGRALKNRRSQIILATKVNGRIGEGINDRGLSRRHILNAVDASLSRLNTDYIDIYYLHAPDNYTSLDETFHTMTTLVESGKIRYIGISNYAAWQIANIMALCDKRNYVSPSITQNVYNLITRGIEVELIPFLDTQNIALTIYNPIAGGLLSGKYDFQKGPQDHTLFATNRMYLNRFWLKENFIAIKKLTEIAESYGISMLQLAYKWCIQNRAVASTISGVSNLSQLKQNISILEGGPLDQEIITACDEVWCSLPNNRFDYILK